MLAVVQVARAASCEHPDGIAAVASVEITKALGELGLEGPEALDLAAGLVELGDVGVAHQAHRRWRRRLGLPLADDGLDIGQRQPELLQLADPADPHQRVRTEEAVAPLRARVGREETELLVQVNRADGLLGRLREIADLEQIGVARLAVLAAAGRPRGRARRRRGLGRRNQRKMSGSGGHGGWVGVARLPTTGYLLEPLRKRKARGSKKQPLRMGESRTTRPSRQAASGRAARHRATSGPRTERSVGSPCSPSPQRLAARSFLSLPWTPRPKFARP